VLHLQRQACSRERTISLISSSGSYSGNCRLRFGLAQRETVPHFGDLNVDPDPAIS